MVDSKCDSFQIMCDLLNSKNLKVATAQLCNELQVCNCPMLQLLQKKVNNIFQQNAIMQ